MKSTAQAKVNFISGNWVNNLTPEEQKFFYSEIVDFFTEEVAKDVLEKYNKPIAYKYQNL